MDEAENPPPKESLPKPFVPAPVARVEPVAEPIQKESQVPEPKIEPPHPSPPEDGSDYHSDI
jgi:hypothetical protein